MKVVAAITASIAAHAILFALAALLVAAGGEEVLPPSMEVSRVDLCLSGSEEDSAARSSSFFEPAEVVASVKPPEPMCERPEASVESLPPPEPDALREPRDIRESSRPLPPPQTVVSESKLPATDEKPPDRARIDAPARMTENIKPDYPAGSRLRKEEGNVVLELEILESGRVGEAKVAVSSGYRELDASAVKAAMRTRFSPARSGGKAVSSRAKITVRFVLK